MPIGPPLGPVQFRRSRQLPPTALAPMALVDVVIVNYDSGPHLARAIDALRRQTFADFRVIVVDNASRDGSAEGLPHGPVPLEVLRAGENLGFAGGNNLALRARVTAPWVALLNPDAFPRRDWLEKLVAAARHHPTCFFGCKMLDGSDTARIDGVGDAYHVSGRHWGIGHGGPDRPCYAQPREIFGPCAAAALYRTSDLLEIEGFDEDFFCYAEDVDLAFRLRLLGRRCWYVPEAVVEHIGSATTGRRRGVIRLDFLSVFPIRHIHSREQLSASLLPAY